jgi:hypothetical protein
MTRLLLRIATRIALCAAFSWCSWRVGGPLLALLGTPLYGIALARPLVDLASELKHAMRAAVWRPEEGRYYAYRGTPVRVIEDADHVRWVRAADVRAIVGFTASDGALALTYPQGWKLIGTPPVPHFSDEALLTHLRKERSARAGRFALWAERTITHPARRLRGAHAEGRGRA